VPYAAPRPYIEQARSYMAVYEAIRGHIEHDYGLLVHGYTASVLRPYVRRVVAVMWQCGLCAWYADIFLM
jgi:hypothetical protein